MKRLALLAAPLLLLGGCPTNTLDQNKDSSLAARVSATPRTGYAPLTVSLDGRSSTSTVTIVSYNWTFGDGSPAIDASTGTHIFSAPGRYTVELTVTDQDGASASDTSDIVVY